MVIDTCQLIDVINKHHLWLADHKQGERAVLFACDLSNADIQGVDLTDAVLVQCNVTNANFTSVNGTGAIFYQCNFTCADLTHARFSNAQWVGCCMDRAILTHADMTSCDMTDTDIRCADTSAIQADIVSILPYIKFYVDRLMSRLRDGLLDGSLEIEDMLMDVEHGRQQVIEPWELLPATTWFEAIGVGDTPDNSQIVHLTLEWIEAWQKTLPQMVFRTVNMVDIDQFEFLPSKQQDNMHNERRR